MVSFPSFSEQVRRLAQEVRDLTLSRPITIVNGHPSPSGMRRTYTRIMTLLKRWSGYVFIILIVDRKRLMRILLYAIQWFVSCYWSSTNSGSATFVCLTRKFGILRTAGRCTWCYGLLLYVVEGKTLLSVTLREAWVVGFTGQQFKLFNLHMVILFFTDHFQPDFGRWDINGIKFGERLTFINYCHWKILWHLYRI